MDWDSMLHHISIFYAILEENVMIQTVMSFIFYVKVTSSSVRCVIMWLLFTDVFISMSCDFRNCIYKVWVSSQQTHINFLYIFGEFPIVPTVMEKCRWRCKYLQYRHVTFYYGE